MKASGLGERSPFSKESSALEKCPVGLLSRVMRFSEKGLRTCSYYNVVSVVLSLIPVSLSCYLLIFEDDCVILPFKETLN